MTRFRYGALLAVFACEACLRAGSPTPVMHRSAPPEEGVGSAQPDSESARYAAALDSVLGIAGVPRLESERLAAGDREVRITTGGSMFYEPEYVLRVWIRNGIAGGEWFETWRRIHEGGPLGLERQGLAGRGCRTPRKTERRWICRLVPARPVDWGRVIARLDSLHAWSLPPQQPDLSMYATDQGYVLISARTGNAFNAVYYYGAYRQKTPESRDATAIGALLDDLVSGGYRLSPASP